MESLKELREKTGKSMRLTAEELGIPYTTYVSYEKGAREPNSEMLVKIAEYYHTTIDFLLGRFARNSMTAPTTEEYRALHRIAEDMYTTKAPGRRAEDLSAEELEIVSILRKMSPEQLARELAYLRQASADGQDK